MKLPGVSAAAGKKLEMHSSEGSSALPKVAAPFKLLIEPGVERCKDLRT